ncbi:MAG: HlyD family type I secretion periplasmic adaptor subunit [Campylobacterota bacterium]|nr:HlyD family type I secretion periplasmic adaptor subunit [Campylobacterota bacterium]
MSDNLNKNLSKRDYEFMHSLSSAVLQTTPKTLKAVLYFWLVAIAGFIIWASFASIDEIARGDGDIIPSGENQMIQNLEGGIIEEILVEEGDAVKKGQLLIRIDNQKSISSYSSNAIKADSIEAKIVRLEAEASGKDFNPTKELIKRSPHFIENEKSLFLTNKKQLNSKLNALNEQLLQRKGELSEAQRSVKDIKESLGLITKELKMTKPMVLKGVKSKIEFYQLQRQANDIRERYNGVKLSIPRLKSAVKEVENTIEETKLKYKSDAKLKLNEAISEFKGFSVTSTALQDQVKRTLVRAPMNGIVQKLFVHTVGGVVQPGADILEIVPSDTNLLVEVKIKPADIAFIYFGQKAIVKFTAYDFAIYGGLDGKVVHISADTITDQKDNVFYTVRIKTDKNFLGSQKKPLKIIPGMTVSVDIITGRKTVLDYILKPILKTKQYTFTER